MQLQPRDNHFTPTHLPSLPSLGSLVIAAAVAVMLSACGGGGDDSSPVASTGGTGSTNTGSGSSNTGSGSTGTGATNQGGISAPFQFGNASRYMLISPTSTSIGGSLTGAQQDANGIMTTIGGYQLSGDYAAQDIAGDANFAIGRWVQGTVTFSTSAMTTTTTLTSTGASAYHYIAYQWPGTLPSAASLHCAGGNFTIPTYASGGGSKATPAHIGTAASGTADIAFSNGTATLSGLLTVNANGETANLTLNNTLGLTPSALTVSGTVLSISGSGAAFQLADEGNGTYGLAIMYILPMPSGASYIGVGRLDCASN